MKKTRKKKRDRKKKEIWNLTKKIIGIILIAIGILGLFLPLLQGILLIIIGIALFENKSIKEAIVSFVDKIKRKRKKIVKT